MGEHACETAYTALRAAGHDPEVVHARSLGPLPAALQTRARKEVKEHTGSYFVPALDTGTGEWIGDSAKIIAWAENNPAG